MGKTKLDETYIYKIIKSALKCNSFDVAIGIKIPFLRVLFTVEPGRSLLQLVTTNCLRKWSEQFCSLRFVFFNIFFSRWREVEVCFMFIHFISFVCVHFFLLMPNVIKQLRYNLTRYIYEAYSKYLTKKI